MPPHQDTHKIWMYWHNGVNNAPPLARICIESWRRRNPGYTVFVLDDDSLPEWVDMQDVRRHNPRITIQAFSDVLRWRLLARYGGIWADSTLYCVKPLEKWLSLNVTPNGFFCFRSPEAFLYHSWFLVGHPASPIVQAMNDELERFFITYGGYRHYWELRGIWRLYRLLERLAGRHNQEIWRSYFFRKYLKAAPYFFVMYLMGAATRRSSDAFADFASLTMKYGECPHALQNMTLPNLCPSLASIKELLDGPCPVQKLTTKRYVPEWTAGGVLDLLDGYGHA